MKLSPAQLLPPVLGLLTLVLVLNVTTTALRQSGAWQRAQTRGAPHVDPYSRLTLLLARGSSATPPVRDPFGGIAIATPTPAPGPERPRVPAAPVEKPRPLLTSIVWDADPRATVRWGGRDWSVRENTLFSDFRVVSITREQVVLDRGGEQIVLRLPLKGDTTP